MRTRFLKAPAFSIGKLRFSIDPLLPVMIVVLAWLLSTRYYPSWFFTTEISNYYLIGGISALGITLSILLHELGHAIVARWMNMPVKTVHLLLLGGMAELRERPRTPQQEGMIALAGPVSSLLIAGLVHIGTQFVSETGGTLMLFLQFMVMVNLMLGLFNIIPVFPLDGGRALRALLWGWTQDFYRASVFCYKVGASLVGIICILAAVNFYFWSPVNAVWIGLLGVYLAWMAINAKPELTTVPSIWELILRVEDSKDLGKLGKGMSSKWGKQSLSDALVPVPLDGDNQLILFKGQDFVKMDEKPGSILPFPLKIEQGRFIDLKLPETFVTDKSLEAQYLPVFNDGAYEGMADAYELRFWLNQGLRLN